MSNATIHQLISQLAAAGEKLELASQSTKDSPTIPKKVRNKVTHQTDIAQKAIHLAMQACLDALKGVEVTEEPEGD